MEKSFLFSLSQGYSYYQPSHNNSAYLLASHRTPRLTNVVTMLTHARTVSGELSVSEMQVVGCLS